MNRFIGIDTSNYTTSVAVCEDGRIVRNIRRLLHVKEGERGLRQSDAVFAHTVALPELMDELDLSGGGYQAVAVSSRPRDVEGSYMPCFLCGVATAKTAATVLDIPLYRFSHQEGHLAAALYSCGRLDLYDKDYIGFHVSGGTTEILLSSGGRVTKLGGTLDISAGKAIDRIGVRLGLGFPCGAALETLARGADAKGLGATKTCVRGFDCNLSGLENKAESLISVGETAERIAAYTIEFVKNTIFEMTSNVLSAYPSLPVVYAGGVMSNRILQEYLSQHFDAYFAAPEYSCDNAAGIAILAKLKWEAEHGSE